MKQHCARCGDANDGWPGDCDGELLCQMCWEAYCAREFWDVMTMEPRTVLGLNVRQWSVAALLLVSLVAGFLVMGGYQKT